MDTLSSSISSFNIPRLHPLSTTHYLLPHLRPSTAKSKPNSTKLSNRTTTFTAPNKSIPQLINPSSQTHIQSKQPPNSHRKASTGYAVALLDAARHHGALEAVYRDVKRLSRWLRNELIAGPEKGEILKEVVRKGKFEKHLVKLVNLLVEKSKVEIVAEVLREFGRVYEEVVIGGKRSQLVMVSGGLKMEKSQVLGIAKSVQKITGAEKVTVRQLAV